MKIKNKFQYIAKPVKVFMTVLIILLAVSIVQGIFIEIERSYTRKNQYKAEEKPEANLSQEEQRQERIRRSLKEFLPDGTIHLIDRVEHISGRRDKVQIYDTNDNLLWEGQSDKKPYEYLSWAEQLRSDFSQQDMKRTQAITPGFSRYIEIPVGLEGSIEQIWRYHPGAQYFKGYDTRGGEIGYIGSNGFTESKSKASAFGKFRQFTAWCPADSFNPILLLQTQKSIYQINFEKKDVELLFESTDTDIRMIRLHAWRSLSPDAEEYIDRQKYRPLIQIQTNDRKQHLILQEPKEQFSFNLRSPSFSATKQAIFVRNYGSDMPPVPDIKSSEKVIEKWTEEVQKKSWNMWTELYKVNNQGNLELVNRYNYTSSPVSGPAAKNRDPRPAGQRYVSQFSPLMYDLFIRYVAIRFWPRPFGYGSGNDFFYDLVLIIDYIRPHSSIINRILSALMMVYVFWHGWPRRTSWGGFVFWLIFTGLLNIAGLLTYLALNHTAVIKCPVCGRRRGLAQVNCVRCKTQLPAPERGKLDLIFSA